MFASDRQGHVTRLGETVASFSGDISREFCFFFIYHTCVPFILCVENTKRSRCRASHGRGSLICMKSKLLQQVHRVEVGGGQEGHSESFSTFPRKQCSVTGGRVYTGCYVCVNNSVRDRSLGQVRVLTETALGRPRD